MMGNGVRLSGSDLLGILHAILPLPHIMGMIGQAVTYFIGNDRKFQILLQKVQDFLVFYEQDFNFRLIFDKRLDLIEKIMKNFTKLMLVIYQLPVLAAIITTIITNEVTYAIYFIMPIIDEKSVLGFCINTFVHWICLLIAFVFQAAFYTANSFSILQLIPKVDIFERKMKNFSLDLHEVSENSRKSSGEPILDQTPPKTNKQELIEIVKFYRECKSFIDFNIDYIKFSVFGHISLSAIGIGMSLIILYKLSFAMGFTCLLGLISQIAFPCIFGTIIEHQNQRIVNIICEFPFHNLDVSDQKIYLQFLLFAMNSKALNLPIIGNTNMELFATIMNGGYSYFTFIWNFL